MNGVAANRSGWLKPVFSVAVAGHRQARLAANWLQQGDPSARTQALETRLASVLARLRERAERAFAWGGTLYTDAAPEYRLLTGQASGVEALTTRAAAGYRYHQLWPRHADELGAGVERAVCLGMAGPGSSEELTDEQYADRDSLVLALSDVLVAVWDGREPGTLASGTARMIGAALSRRQPVVVLELDPARDTPRILVAEASRLTDAWLAEVKVLGPTPRLIHDALVPVELDGEGADGLTAQLDGWLEAVLIPSNPARYEQEARDALRLRLEQQLSPSGMVRAWSGWVAGRLGLAERRPRPIGLLLWLSGIQLWLRAMFRPPRSSQGRQVVETLGTEMRRRGTGGHWLNRAHGFFSALARFDFRGAVRAARRGETPNRYAGVSPSEALRPDHPIAEPELEAAFNWSDAQADVFCSRYRDDTWMIYYAAALAVFCAVAGALHLWPAPEEGVPYFWVFLEFVLLYFIVGRVLRARHHDYHGRWMRFRFLAEQLRYLRFGYPLLVFPETFAEPAWEPAPRQDEPRRLQLKSAELWILQRMLVAEGLPRAASGDRLYAIPHHNAATLDYIKEVLGEHQRYYRRSYHWLHGEHAHLHRLAFGLFVLTFIAVTIHFFVNWPWLLFFTAFLPAWGAAIHGILSQNEVVRVSSMAASVWRELTTLSEAFRLHHAYLLDEGASPAQRDWDQTRELRELVAATIHVLSDANKYWRALLQHNQPELPA